MSWGYPEIIHFLMDFPMEINHPFGGSRVGDRRSFNHRGELCK